MALALSGTWILMKVKVMHKLQDLSIEWNYDNDALLSIAKSSDTVLQDFFSMQDWNFVRHCHNDIYNERDTEHNEKRIEFSGTLSYIYVEEKMSTIQTHECLKVFTQLYDLMVVGANDDHHSVRYEPWWHEFIELCYQLKRKIELQEQLQEGRH